jgi:hypothetical protein
LVDLIVAHFVGEAEQDPTKPTFPEMSEFYRTLKLKIEEYFHVFFAPSLLICLG